MYWDDPLEKYVCFYTDFAFRKLFGTETNKDLLISFLNALLKDRETVKEITFLNAESLCEQEYIRCSVFDMECVNNSGEHFLVEIQKGEPCLFKERSIYYSTFAVRGQAPHGEWNYQLEGIYVICILNSCFDEENRMNYYHEVKLMDVATRTVFHDMPTFIYLEMPKFTKTENELETPLDKWLYAIHNLASLMGRPHVLHEEVFVRLFEVAEIARFDRKECCEYQESLRNYRDWYSVIQSAERRGMAKGLEQALKEGAEQVLK